MSLAAVALRWASARTWTPRHGEAAAAFAGPRASTAAFSARMLVWKAMLSIRPVISQNLLALPADFAHDAGHFRC